MHLIRDFFQRNPLVCARELIGCTIGFGECAGLIVETEAYSSEGDPGCHTWKRPSAREFVTLHQPGTAYVYLNYGVHWLFNFLVKGGECDGFVLIRALEPMAGIEAMQRRRNRHKIEELCNGPGKLTHALAITGKQHACDPFSDPEWILAERMNHDIPTIATTRIGITQAADYPWRFILSGNRFVS